MSKHLLPISIFILSIAVIFCGYQLKTYSSIKSEPIENENKDFSNGLLTEKQAANYLNMSVAKLTKMIDEQDVERAQLTDFQTYNFVPYIRLNDHAYFNKKQLDEWINFNSKIWTNIETE